jgi:hypothetical protein
LFMLQRKEELVNSKLVLLFHNGLPNCEKKLRKWILLLSFLSVQKHWLLPVGLNRSVSNPKFVFRNVSKAFHGELACQ